LVQVLQFLSAHVGKPVSQNVFSRAIEEQNDSLKIRRNQSTAHGVDDILREILQTQKFFTLFLKFAALAAERMNEQAGQISDGQKSEKIHDQPGAEVLDGRQCGGPTRQFAGKCEKRHSGEEGETDCSVQERDTTRKDNASHDDDQQIERNKIAL